MSRRGIKRDLFFFLFSTTILIGRPGWMNLLSFLLAKLASVRRVCVITLEERGGTVAVCGTVL
jgi:hypothetical protein